MVATVRLYPGDPWDEDPEEAPLSWKLCPVVAPGGVLLACDRGHAWAIGPPYSDHVIHPDGRVTASLVCPEFGCSWHVMGVLVGWSP